jgi:sugar lactone lactonase YvrE
MEAKRLDVPISTLAEGPLWDHETQTLYWVDILGKRIHRYDTKTGSTESLELDQYVGAVVPHASGGLVAAMQHGFYRIDFASGRVEPLVDPERDKPENRFNDGKCDPAGRFWAGTMSLTEQPGAGALYRLDRDGTVRKMIDGVSISNGLAWSPDRKTMYFIDTPTRCVSAFDYDLETGEIANRRAVVRIPEEEGYPDGMCIDAEGKLWIAHWEGWQVGRWDPDTGEKLLSVRVPAAQVSSCAFGGPDFRQLFITTARENMSPEELERQPEAGGVFTVRVDVPGVPADKYQGI